jgi:hypothetical protein
MVRSVRTISAHRFVTELQENIASRENALRWAIDINVGLQAKYRAFDEVRALGKSLQDHVLHRGTLQQFGEL